MWHNGLQLHQHALHGEVLLHCEFANPASADEAFQTALAIAKEQGARRWGLQAALSRAKLYQSSARSAEAFAVLAPALEGFSPTPEMPEIAEAQALREALRFALPPYIVAGLNVLGDGTPPPLPTVH
jgi:hypothetical protein